MNFTSADLILYLTICAIGTIMALFINMDENHTKFDIFVLTIHYFSIIFTIMFLINVVVYSVLH